MVKMLRHMYCIRKYSADHQSLRIIILEKSEAHIRRLIPSLVFIKPIFAAN